MMNEPLKTKGIEKPRKLFTGRMYWSALCVRVWLDDGRMMDFGERSLESARVVAEQFGLELRVKLPGCIR